MAQTLSTTSVTPGFGIKEIDPYKPPELPKAPDVEAFEPITRQIDPAKETVAGQMTGLLSSNNPYIAEGRQRGVEMANQRGLLNSSISAGAAEREGIKAAMPIATQDAATYFQQGRANQDIGAKTQGIEQGQQYALQGQEQEAAIKQNLMQTEQGQQLEKMREDAAIRGQMLDLDSQVRERLSGIEQGYALELESMQQNYEIIKNKDTQMGGMYADALKSIATFLDNPDMSAAQQQTGLNTIISNLQAGLQFMAGITSMPGTSTMAESAKVDASREGIAPQDLSDLDIYKMHQSALDQGKTNLSLDDWTEQQYPNRLSDYDAAVKSKEEAAAAEIAAQKREAALVAEYDAYTRRDDAAYTETLPYAVWKQNR